MVRYINSKQLKNLDKIIVGVLKQRQEIKQSSIKYIQLIHNLTQEPIIDIVIKEAIIENDKLIDILHSNNIFPILTNTQQPIKIVDYTKLNDYAKIGYLIYNNNDQQQSILIYDLLALSLLLPTINIEKIKLIKKLEFYQLLEDNFSHLNIIKAKYFLGFISNSITAKDTNYIKVLIGFFIVFFLLLQNFLYVFHIINNICYCLQNFLKILLFYNSLIILPQEILPKTKILPKILVIESKNILPIYTILIPLYKESEKLSSIIENISNLNYPKDRLDIKIIVEADDNSMIKQIILQDLPNYITLLKVPFSLPRTKPKALNYAMQYCKGKYTVIYDAEDRPDANQLLIAVAEFANLGEQVVCLQSKLNFYNLNENLLTKLFSLEYSLWFEYILKGLTILNLPVPLGGTSNHFKTDILQKIGCWDAYNVTEDADLGIRLYSLGYKVHMIDSYTLEECPISFGNWLNQRSRWIKGFFQTFLVFLAAKDKLQKFTIWQILSIYIFIGLSFYNFYCLPFLIVTTITNNCKLIAYLWLINSFFAFSYLYASAFFILKRSKDKAKKFLLLDVIALIIWPFYFILHSVACYKAIWESIFRPFEWNKTKHGASEELSEEVRKEDVEN